MNHMVKGKVQMGSITATHAQWYQDALNNCSPEDCVWGWSIRATEVLHHDHAKIDDECLRKMLRQGLCDSAEGAPAWTEKLSVKEGVRLMSSIATRILQKFICLDSKVRYPGCLFLTKLTYILLGCVYGDFAESGYQQPDQYSHEDGRRTVRPGAQDGCHG